MLIYFHKAWQYDAVCFFGFNLMGMPNRPWWPQSSSSVGIYASRCLWSRCLQYEVCACASCSPTVVWDEAYTSKH